VKDPGALKTPDMKISCIQRSVKILIQKNWNRGQSPSYFGTPEILKIFLLLRKIIGTK
jgi:hypothetical protein